jgi:hypothetical protein
MSAFGIVYPSPGNTISAWLEQRAAAVRVCLDSNFVEEALTLVYSAIDTLAFLGSPLGTEYSERGPFIQWCEKYIVPSFGSRAGRPSGIDLYGARCGVLHVSSARSSLGQQGKAREIWYQFRGQDGLNLATNTRKLAVGLGVEELVAAFEKGSHCFLEELNRDQVRYARAEKRARSFFTWATRLL